MFKVTVIGSGLIGSSWAIAFANAGYDVHIYDRDDTSFANSERYIRQELASLNTSANADEVIQRIKYTASLAEALNGAGYVQESIFETLEAKQEIFSAMDSLVDDDVILASSSSSIPCSAFSEALSHRAQCLIAHPVNPPHLIPLVEMVPAPWTDPNVTEKATALMDDIGQTPVVVSKEIEGFILNRLQGALLNEAWWLYQEGYASVDVIDKCISDGLSHRWAFMGPFQTISHNAPGGLVDYAERFRGFNFGIAQSRSNPTKWDLNAAKNAAAEVDALEKGMGLKDAVAWRNDMLRSFKQWKSNGSES
ncbi:3-hydroxyacyl-CoA dehydrogenase [Enterovibrio sp. ZSDZ42]|uniref:3-hydroxyacyl-CoA dehydrogenase n=1 Tax=Enterovibrio gelatinilyticus TaxID=2899819 RepID=A0ABT5R1A8_9GAMM|nr:3-hydroxyacyl-CoA dehydrogenase [Enterovibrio sp. ZSDZ42]MDD1794059.1 3-hydroxyacyl-CoA dehydrogenase [Enterovibrio sp. ZSDZ42]